jgi:ribosomal protein L30/L7E
MEPATTMSLPYRKVGNVLMIHCTDHPFKYSWELNSMLRQLRIEYRGQVVIHPDIPDIRLALWRVRHIVHVEAINTDAVKEMLGIPEHVSFKDLARELPHIAKESLGTSGYMEQVMDFRQLRRDRIKDIMKRDRLELTLLAERKKLRAAQQAKDANQ